MIILWRLRRNLLHWTRRPNLGAKGIFSRSESCSNDEISELDDRSCVEWLVQNVEVARLFDEQ